MEVKLFMFGNTVFIGELVSESESHYLARNVLQLALSPTGEVKAISFGFGMASQQADIKFPKASTIIATPKLEVIKIYSSVESGLALPGNDASGGGGLTYGGKQLEH